MYRSISPLLVLAMLITLLAAWPQPTALTTSFPVVLADIGLDQSASLVIDWATDGVDNGVEYGSAVASAGDINNDGYDDVIVGAPKYLVDGERSGSAFVFLGSPSGLSSSIHRQLYPTDKGSSFGAAVSSAGDVNKDGYDDVIVGAPNHNEPEQQYIGAVYLYLGTANGIPSAPAWSKIGFGKDARFGTSVCGVGDVNGDGYDDVLVGSIALSNPENNEGAVYLFLGNVAGLSQTPVWSMESNQTSAQLGYAVAALGDINRDGFDDFAVSAPGFDSGEDDEGKVWVVTGASNAETLAPVWTAEGELTGAHFGSDLDGAGDVDGNGYKDLLVGAHGYTDNDDLSEVGGAFLFYNHDGTLDAAAGWMDTADQEYSGFGIAVAGLGDINEDGYDDIAIGAHRYSDDQTQEGFVFIYRGSAFGTEYVHTWHASGNKAETEFGFAVAGAGFVNNDNKADIVIGAPTYKRDEKTVMGRAFVYLGTDGSQVVSNQVFLPMITAND